MKFDYVIVQCGGLGTRLFPYTQNMPKAMVPVNNRPIIFHLFEKYSDKKFVIISDYRSDVFNRYLECFAGVDYVPIITREHGNAAGVDRALQIIPDGESFLLLWSDLILGEGFCPEALTGKDCFVGVTKAFPCSWSSTEGKLDKVSGDVGVAGCFLFKDKSVLRKLPADGSLTAWLRDNDIPYGEMDMADTVEVGTVEALQRVDSKENRCRPYNRITIDNGRVIKEGLTTDAITLIDREIAWYDYLSERDYPGIPKIYEKQPLTMGYINGTNLFLADIPAERKEQILDSVIKRLKLLHALEPCEPNCFDMEHDYYRKTIKRLRMIESVLPFSMHEIIRINEKDCVNVLQHTERLQALTVVFMNDADFGVIHGDCTFTNTLIDENGDIFFIDARGYFGDTALFGDLDYDWAKVYYSVRGSFDQFNIGAFEIKIQQDSVTYKIRESGWESLEPFFWSQIGNRDATRIRFIHAIIWLSLASHCWENYDAMCLAYYNGLYLLQSVWEEAAAKGMVECV